MQRERKVGRGEEEVDGEEDKQGAEYGEGDAGVV